MNVVSVEAQDATALGRSDPVGRLTEALAQGGLAMLLGSIEIPVSVEDRLKIPEVDSKRLQIAAQSIPLRIAVQEVKVFSGRLWIFVDATFARAPLRSSRRRVESCLAGRARTRGRRRSSACGAKAPREDPGRMATLESTHDRLHERLAKAAAAEPLLASALRRSWPGGAGDAREAARGARANVARHYLDRVTLDLTGVFAHRSGELRKKTFLGRVKLGAWNVSLEIDDLVGDLRAGSPRVGLRGPDLIDIAVPVDVQETEGGATLHFGWDSEALVNLVCRDFELTREIRGRVLAQSHLLSGALRLDNTGGRLTATPVFPDRRVRLKVDLTPRSWGVVEEALRSQDTPEGCGMVMHPDEGLVRLRELAAKGIMVHLPDSIFRPVSLPARLHTSVKVNEAHVGLRLKAESLRIETSDPLVERFRSS